MQTARTYIENPFAVLTFRLQDYVQLIKLRLSLLVVFSSGMGYLFGATEPIVWSHLGLLLLSGFLITGSANGINQIIEKEPDKLMTRTANRPVATGRLQVWEAALITVTMGIIGVGILSVYLNGIAALLGLFSLLAYAFVYTPLKRTTSFAVLAGAFPGAMPPIIGYVAIAGNIDMACLSLFIIQFIWQFPHFWSIAWMLDDDYKKAGFNLLPMAGQKDRKSGFTVFITAMFLIPSSIIPMHIGAISVLPGSLILAFSLAFVYLAYKVFSECNELAARRLMIGSVIYLPLLQIIMVLGKL